jgi:hypothetical protein
MTSRYSTEQMLNDLISPVEIDLRSEIGEFFDGSNIEIPKAYTIIHRKMRLDRNEYLIRCQCNHREEGVHHYECSLCKGEGYIWDESYVSTFKVEKSKSIKNSDSGTSNVKTATFYFEYDKDITLHDKLIELAIDKNGNPRKPLTRGNTWTPKSIDHKRSDKGRTEYIIVECTLSSAVKKTGRRNDNS